MADNVWGFEVGLLKFNNYYSDKFFEFHLIFICVRLTVLFSIGGGKDDSTYV